jgi:ubiquinol-cytochrome c reductase cytochrome c subunit
MPAVSRLLPAGVVVVAAALSLAVRPSSDAVAAPVLADRGGQVYVLRCQSCHLASGLGQPAKGVPSLRGVGAAAVDFYVSTGRMPASDYSSQAPRRPVTVTPADTDALIAYITTTWPGGPDVPTVAPGADLVTGGDLFRTNCAACHGAVGAGAALAFGAFAPTLHKATELQVAEAIRVGPANMPVFDARSLAPAQVSQIAAYVEYLHHPDDRGGAGLGWVGPIAEGFVGLLVGLAGTVGIAAWVGHRSDDEPMERRV